MSIILLKGFSQSGKDFIGKILCDNYNYERYAFADSLKSIVSQKYKCDINLLHSQTGKMNICENDILKRSYRQILIDEAANLRHINQDVFVNYCCNEIYKTLPQKIVITDWRYLNEMEIIRKQFPNYLITTIHVIREDQKESPVSDISEYNLTEQITDFTIINKMDNSIYEDVLNIVKYITNI